MRSLSFVVVLALPCVALALPCRALADSLPACGPGTHMVANPTPPGSMHHGGAHCEPDPGAPTATAESETTTTPSGSGGRYSVGHTTTRGELPAVIGILGGIAIVRGRRRR